MTAVLAAVVVAVLVVAFTACRADDRATEDDRGRRDDRPAGRAPVTEPAAPRAHARAERVPLTASDLGRGWRDQGAPDTASGPAGLALVHPCLEDAPGDGEVVAAARSAELLHLEGDAERTVVTAAAVLADQRGASQLFTRMAGDAFAACVVLGRVNDIADAAGTDRTTDTAAGPVQPYPAAGIEAVWSAAVVSVSDPETLAQFDAHVHVVAMREGATVALLVAQSLFHDLPDDQLAAMARRLAERMG